MNQKFNHSLFVANIEKNLNVKEIKLISTNIYQIEFIDGLLLLVTIGSEDDYHKFYTSISEIKYFYVDRMPHNTYTDLYFEINRIGDKNRRSVVLPKYASFKAY